MPNEFVEWLLAHGWVDGHAPEGVRAERMKYRTEEGTWVAFHKPEISEAELMQRMAAHQRQIEAEFPWERGR